MEPMIGEYTACRLQAASITKGSARLMSSWCRVICSLSPCRTRSEHGDGPEGINMALQARKWSEMLVCSVKALQVHSCRLLRCWKLLAQHPQHERMA